MRIQCDSCQAAEASVVCCADEAALCKECDIQVHDANKLAGKHQRVPLSRPPTNTLCDICQEKTAYFFCLEDRALLCHGCDVSIHRSNTLTSNHRRFLVTGVTASLHTLCTLSTVSSQSTSQSKPVKQTKKSTDSKVLPPEEHISSTVTTVNRPAVTVASTSTFTATVNQEAPKKTSIFEFLTQAVPGWKCDELLNMSDCNFNTFGFNTNLDPSPKLDANSNISWSSGNFGEQIYSRSVPTLGLNGLNKTTETEAVIKGKTKDEFYFEDAFLVPDLGLHSVPELPPVMKRRRTYSELDNIFLT